MSSFIDLELVRPLSEYEAFLSGEHSLSSRYSFVRSLQLGAFGSVCQAYDSFLNIDVSIKSVLKVESDEHLLGVRTTTDIARLEIKALEALTESGNSCVCQMLDCFESYSHVHMVLEFCAKGDLYDLVHSRSLTMHEVLKLSRQLGDAVNFSHSRGVYHRDIKPENVLIDAMGNFKLCDWGLASFERYSSEFDVGTDRYMAPECFLRGPDGSGRVVDKYDCKSADYWSVGMTMLTAIFGHAPFRAPQEGSGCGIKDDTNFRNFVLYNDRHVLYDIYPSMNLNCFDIITKLLYCGSKDDDSEAFKKRLALRDLQSFVSELDKNWIYGLLVDDNFETASPSSHFKTSDVFNMDHDDLWPENYDAEKVDEECGPELFGEDLSHAYSGSPVPIGNLSFTNDDWLGLQLPSLIELSIESLGLWCDWVDLDTLALDQQNNGPTRMHIATPALAPAIQTAKFNDTSIRFEDELAADETIVAANWIGC